MKILILPNKEKAVRRAAGILAEKIAAKPDAVLGLATGGTMLNLYRELIALTAKEQLSFAGVTTFNLDEYVGLAPAHAASYHAYMKDCLFSKVDLNPDHTHLPRGDAPDPDEEARRYEALIFASGGIDLQLLGIGRNGHIGFNEPSSSLASRTRVKTLATHTLGANRQYFDNPEDMPKLALTMGVGTILDSQVCLLLATGADKAEAVANMAEGPVSASCPASVLQFHQRVTVVLDDDAAGLLKMRDYYEYVHPSDAEPG